MKTIVFIIIILFSFSISFAGEKRWIGTNDKGYITKHKRVRKSTPRNYPKPKFIPYPNVYWETGDGKKHHLGKHRVK